MGDIILRIVAGEESGTTYEEFKRISDKYDTIRLFVQRDNGEKEIVVNKTWLFPEGKRQAVRMDNFQQAIGNSKGDLNDYL